MTSSATTSLLIIGAGPAGTAAALRGAELGADVTVVEGDRIGGVCTNTGCTPVRVLAKTARLLRDARRASDYGIELGQPTLSWPGLLSRVDEVVADVHAVKRVEERFAAGGVTLITGEGRARFVDPHTVELRDSGRRLSADRIVVAVGGHSRRLPLPGAEHATLGEEVLDLPDLPSRVVVIGSGSTGVQLSTVFRAFGSEVVLVEAADRIMPTADADVAGALGDAYRDQGVAVRVGAAVSAIERAASGQLQVVLGDDEERLDADAVVMCVGWPANVEDLGLDAAGVTVEGGRIVTDEYTRTSVPHIHACGDANGRAMLVQAAHQEGEAAAVNAVLGPTRAATHGLLPWGGFTDPDIAGVGLTEEAARDRDPMSVTVRVDYAEMERPVIDGVPRGFLKLVLDRRRELILGAHAVGEDAVEVVTAVTTSMAADVRPATLAMVEYAYPTYSAIIGEACRRAMST